MLRTPQNRCSDRTRTSFFEERHAQPENQTLNTLIDGPNNTQSAVERIQSFIRKKILEAESYSESIDIVYYLAIIEALDLEQIIEHAERISKDLDTSDITQIVQAKKIPAASTGGRLILVSIISALIIKQSEESVHLRYTDLQTRIAAINTLSEIRKELKLSLDKATTAALATRKAIEDLHSSISLEALPENAQESTFFESKLLATTEGKNLITKIQSMYQIMAIAIAFKRRKEVLEEAAKAARNISDNLSYSSLVSLSLGCIAFGAVFALGNSVIIMTNLLLFVAVGLAVLSLGLILAAEYYNHKVAILDPSPRHTGPRNGQS